MTKKQAIKRGSLLYTGKVCERHPELGGQRRVKNGCCHACIVERMRTPHSRKLAREARRRRKEKAPGADSVRG